MLPRRMFLRLPDPSPGKAQPSSSQRSKQINVGRPSATQISDLWPVTGQPYAAGTGQAMGVCRKAQPWSRVRHWRATPQPQAYVGTYR